MRVKVRLQGCDERLRHDVERRVSSQVGHLKRTLKELTVCLSTLPDGRHRCRMSARPLPWATVVVEEEDGAADAAIERASSRLEATIQAVMHVPVIRAETQAVARVAHTGAANSSAAATG